MIFKIFLLLLLFLTSLFGNSNMNPRYDSSLFTQKEISWLKKTKKLKYVYDPDWAPFEWKNDSGQHVGVIADIIKIIERKIHIDFVAKNTNSWKESLEQVKRKRIHIFSAITPTKERAKYLNFTKHDIFSYSAVIVANFNDKHVYLDVSKDMKYKRVGIVRGNGLGSYLEKNYTDLNFISVGSTHDGLEMVKNGEIDLFVINAITARYFIEKYYSDTLKVALKLNHAFHLKLGASKQVSKELIPILDKVLQSIPQDEFSAILNKWTSIKVEKTRVDWRLIVEIVSLLLIVIIIIMIHNRRLQRAVNKKTEELRQLNEKLRMAANTDSLTGIPNRRQLGYDFDYMIKSSNRHGKKSAVLFLDIDGFKKVNDAFGHDAGDELLKKISTLVTTTLRGAEKIYRIGGDEFFIFVPAYDSDKELEHIAHRVIDKISNISISDTLSIGVSIGIALFPEDGKDLEELINFSDKAMYAVKKSGKNNFLFAAEIHQKTKLHPKN